MWCLTCSAAIGLVSLQGTARATNAGTFENPNATHRVGIPITMVLSPASFTASRPCTHFPTRENVSSELVSETTPRQAFQARNHNALWCCRSLHQSWPGIVNVQFKAPLFQHWKYTTPCTLDVPTASTSVLFRQSPFPPSVHLVIIARTCDGARSNGLPSSQPLGGCRPGFSPSALWGIMGHHYGKNRVGCPRQPG